MTKIEAITAPDPAALDEALLQWWERLLAHAETQPDADRLIADAWAETGRLIGSVQREGEPIGTDRGLRVVLTAPALANDVQQAGFSREAHLAAHAVLFAAFERTRRRLADEGRFVGLWGGRACCYYCEEGGAVAEPSLAPRPKPARRVRR